MRQLEYIQVNGANHLQCFRNPFFLSTCRCGQNRKLNNEKLPFCAIRGLLLGTGKWFPFKCSAPHSEREHIRNEEHSYGSSAALITLMKMRREQKKNMLNVENLSLLLLNTSPSATDAYTISILFIFIVRTWLPRPITFYRGLHNTIQQLTAKTQTRLYNAIAKLDIVLFLIFSCERNLSNTQGKITVRSTAHTLISHGRRLYESNESRYTILL